MIPKIDLRHHQIAESGSNDKGILYPLQQAAKPTSHRLQRLKNQGLANCASMAEVSHKALAFRQRQCQSSVLLSAGHPYSADLPRRLHLHTQRLEIQQMTTGKPTLSVQIHRTYAVPKYQRDD